MSLNKFLQKKYLLNKCLPNKCLPNKCLPNKCLPNKCLLKKCLLSKHFGQLSFKTNIYGHNASTLTYTIITIKKAQIPIFFSNKVLQNILLNQNKFHSNKNSQTISNDIPKIYLCFSLKICQLFTTIILVVVPYFKIGHFIVGDPFIVNVPPILTTFVRIFLNYTITNILRILIYTSMKLSLFNPRALAL